MTSRSCCQSYCQGWNQSSTTVRDAGRATFRATVRGIVTAQPLSEYQKKANFYSQASRADGYLCISKRTLGGVNSSIRNHHQDKNFQAGLQIYTVTAVRDYSCELNGREWERLGKEWFISRQQWYWHGYTLLCSWDILFSTQTIIRLHQHLLKYVTRLTPTNTIYTMNLLGSTNAGLTHMTTIRRFNKKIWLDEHPEICSGMSTIHHELYHITRIPTTILTSAKCWCCSKPIVAELSAAVSKYTYFGSNLHECTTPSRRVSDWAARHSKHWHLLIISSIKTLYQRVNWEDTGRKTFWGTGRFH